MTITVNLVDDKQVLVDDRTAEMGGSFYMSPHLQPYSPLPLKWAYEQLIRYPKATLIDVGANTGCYSLLAAHHPDLTVHAFEPVDLTYRVLRENVYLNGLLDKVTVNRAGVSNYNGTGTLFTMKEIGGLGVSMVNGDPAPHKEVQPSTVEVVTIDRYCVQHEVVPTFIKSDTEGAEKFVLEGAQGIIGKHHPFLLFEYSQTNADQYGYPINELIVMIESWGYVWTSPEGLDIWAVHRDWETRT